MSWPKDLQSSNGFNDKAYDSQRNNALQDGDNPERSSYFISETSEFETDMVFNSRPQVIDWVQNTGRRLGYVVVIKRSDANLNISFMCDRGGIYKSKKVSTKKTSSKRINCPFALKAKCLSIDDCWSLKVICEIHNHEPALHLEGHPYPRRLSENESRLVEELIRNNVKPRDILSTKNSYVHQEPPMYYSHPLMDEISYEFHPYVTHIENVIGDGNCGFRATTVSLGYREDYFPTIRFDLYNELLAHTEEYRWMFGCDFEAISHTLNYFGSRAVGTDRWLIVPYTGLLIANKYGVVVNLLDKRGSSTFFPSRLGPQDIPNHRVVVIALVYGNHYVKVDLQREHPMPTISPLWNHFKLQRSAAWETLYSVRLNAYIPPNVPGNNYDNLRINISDSY